MVFAALALSRFTAVTFMASHPYARASDADARAGQLAGRMSSAWLWFAAVGGLLPVVAGAAWVSWSLVWVLPGTALIWIWFAISFSRRLGGYTGDCLGAVQQVSETWVYLMAASMWLV